MNNAGVIGGDEIMMIDFCTRSQAPVWERTSGKLRLAVTPETGTSEIAGGVASAR